MTDPDRTVAVVAIVASIAVLAWAAAVWFARWAARRVGAMVTAALGPVDVANECHAETWAAVSFAAAEADRIEDEFVSWMRADWGGER